MTSQNQNSQNTQVSVSVASEKIEAFTGVMIAFFAALMAISDMTSGNISEDKENAMSKNNSYFSWYQSKSIKQSLQESHLNTLEAFITTGMVKSDKVEVINKEIEKTKADIKRYKMEKKEILEGSSTLPQTEWIQELDGKMGAIVGVKQWEKQVEKLNKATNQLDMSMLFFQISLVLGAVCIVIYDNPRLQKTFTLIMIISGIVGVVFSIYGYLLAN